MALKRIYWISSIALLMMSTIAPAASKKPLDWSLPLKTLDGKTESLKQFHNKKVIIINFWATWCGPCRSEMPDFEKFYQAYKDRGVVIIGISVDTSTGDVRKFLRDVKVSYPIYRDGPNGPWAKAYSGLPFLPMTVIYRGNGERVKTFIGPRTFDDLKEVVEPLLSSASRSEGSGG